MTKKEFLVFLQESLKREKCAETDVLAEYDEWDSLGQIIMIGDFDEKFGLKITSEQISQAKKVSDLMVLAGIK